MTTKVLFQINEWFEPFRPLGNHVSLLLYSVFYNYLNLLLFQLILILYLQYLIILL